MSRVFKSRNSLIAVSVMLLVIFGGVYYFFSNNTFIDKNNNVVMRKDDLVTQESTYMKDGNIFKFIKNRITKTASFDMTYELVEKDEFSDFMGTKITTVPFLINYFCSALNESFFDPSVRKALSASKSAEISKVDSVTEDDQFQNALTGYKITEFSIVFKDQAGEIASCQSTQKGFENIKFSVVRDFSEYNSFFGQKIGVVKN